MLSIYLSGGKGVEVLVDYFPIPWTAMRAV